MFKNHYSYWLTRLLYLRGLGGLYVLTGLILFWQGPALIGPDGLTPVEPTIEALVSQDLWWQQFYKYPSLLLFSGSNTMINLLATLMVLGGVVLVVGFCNWPLLLLLWFCQMSLVNGAGRFWSFGWETMLLEMTFMSLFFVHPWYPKLLSKKSWVPNYLTLVPLLWMSFRLLFGAGLIKIRGDACWLDFTCMDYHYQTQPNPHFLSWYYHNMPWWFHRFEIAMTHFYELLVPFLFLLIRPLRVLGALLIVFFQFTLISTGNLAFLNWQTVFLVIVALDDKWLRPFVLQSTSDLAQTLSHQKMKLPQQVMLGIGLIAVILLSYKPVSNMISPNQRMNESYDGLHLLNSYGLFGSITKQRYEIIISGTDEAKVTGETEWREYEFHCKPGNIDRKPCWITPYHLRLDWQMWFSAMRPKLGERWLLNLGRMMLVNDKHLETLIAENPFAGEEPPKFVKMDLYLYEFTEWGDNPEHWWQRELVKSYMPPISIKK